MQADNWAIMANDYVEGLEAEKKENHKKFYNENDGRGRARAAIAKLDTLKQRLQALA